TGHADRPVLSLGLGFLGAAAVVALSALLTRARGFDWLRYLGQHSIVVYLAFFLPMAASRVVLIKLGVGDAGTVSALVTLIAVSGALLWYWSVRGTPLRFLFERPARFRLENRRKPLADQ